MFIHVAAKLDETSTFLIIFTMLHLYPYGIINTKQCSYYTNMLSHFIESHKGFALKLGMCFIKTF